MKIEYILNKLLDAIDRHLETDREANPCEEQLSGLFTLGNHAIRYAFSKKRGCELEIWNPTKDTFLDNVSMYCEKRCLRWDDVVVEETDCWDCNGFRDEQDYINYKYG